MRFGVHEKTAGTDLPCSFYVLASYNLLVYTSIPTVKTIFKIQRITATIAPIIQRIFPAFAMPALLEPIPILALEIPTAARRILIIGLHTNNTLKIPSTSPAVAAPVLSTVLTGTAYVTSCPSGISCCSAVNNCSRLVL